MAQTNRLTKKTVASGSLLPCEPEGSPVLAHSTVTLTVREAPGLSASRA